MTTMMRRAPARSERYSARLHAVLALTYAKQKPASKSASKPAKKAKGTAASKKSKATVDEDMDED